jgi:hypothetical protein
LQLYTHRQTHTYRQIPTQETHTDRQIQTHRHRKREREERRERERESEEKNKKKSETHGKVTSENMFNRVGQGSQELKRERERVEERAEERERLQEYTQGSREQTKFTAQWRKTYFGSTFIAEALASRSHSDWKTLRWILKVFLEERQTQHTG